MHQFEERHPALYGFSHFYFQVIGPRLKQEDELRRKGALKMILVTALSLLVLIVWVYVSLKLSPVIFGNTEETVMINISITVILVLNLITVPSVMLVKTKQIVKYSLIGGLCRFKHWSYWKDTPLLGTSWEFKELNLIPTHGTSSYEGHISGKAHGAKFEFVRLELSKPIIGKDAPHSIKFIHKKDPYPFKFKYTGQIISIEFERKFHGRTIVFSDRGIFNKSQISDMKPIRLVDPVFEKMFEVYGTDQVYSRTVLTPDLMHRLVELEHTFKGKAIRFGFVDKRLLIAIDTQMRLGAGSMFRPLDEPVRMQNVLNVIAAIYNVIDGVTKPLKPITVNPYSPHI